MGVAVIGLGALLTWAVIAAGQNREGLQAVPPFAWTTLWLGCKVGLALVWLASADRARSGCSRGHRSGSSNWSWWARRA